MKLLISCETYPGYSHHVRLISVTPPHYAGHASPYPRSLCGREVRWDTKVPVDASGCTKCDAAIDALDKDVK